jgi:hypothetical protein
VIVINGSLLTAVQSQETPRDLSFTVLEPPFAGSLILAGLTVNMQFKGVAWSTVNV